MISLKLVYYSSKRCTPDDKIIFTREELQQNDGTDVNKRPYLAFMGRVYDVDKGLQHYRSGGSYAHLAGRDGTRGFLTGDFTQSGLTDDISDLQAITMSGVREWIQFYDREYPYLGVVIGSYYDRLGCETPKLKQVHQKIAEYAETMRIKEKLEQEYPPCHSQRNENSGTTRLWCTTMSGGITREWSGVPRQIISPGFDDRCGCFKLQDDSLGVEDTKAVETSGPASVHSPSNGIRVEQYSGCNPQAIQCLLYDRQPLLQTQPK